MKQCIELCWTQVQTSQMDAILIGNVHEDEDNIRDAVDHNNEDVDQAEAEAETEEELEEEGDYELYEEDLTGDVQTAIDDLQSTIKLLLTQCQVRNVGACLTSIISLR